MNQYSMIAYISNYICSLLKKHMTPNPILNKDSIGLCSPNDRGDLNLGIFLYDINENQNIRNRSMINIGKNEQKYPSRFLELYYMVTAYSNTELKYKYVDEQKIIGRALQILTDNPNIHMDEIMNIQDLAIREVKIELLNITFEEKLKIWNGQNQPYKLSLCFKVFPIEIQSTRTRNIQRVVETITRIEEKK